jgi:predicted nucleic acid-binding protein
MDSVLILETTFIVDLERETAARKPGAACAFLDLHPDRVLAITLTTAGELGCGVSLSERMRWEGLVRRFRLLLPDRDAAWHYGQIYRFLRDNGRLIGGNDLWIAATALAHQSPVVTRDIEHYRRVPGLEVIPY